MFGSNAGTSTWGQPQQQQQQQQTNAFGQPANAFGSGGAFGQTTTATTGAFGQPQQQQQPAANPMFGSFGGTNTNTTTNTGSAFGGNAFGATNNNASTSAFGAPKPATTAFGGFGGGTTGAFGATSGAGAFGSTNNNATATGAFGQPSTSTGGNAFGTNNGTGVFGTKLATASGTNTMAGGDPNATAPVTTGSSNPAYSAYSEKDATSATVLQYQSISCTPAYRGSSFEELRVQDYMQNRKTSAATNTAGGFGATTGAFGQPTASTSGSVFGQPQPANNTSAFGTGATNAFGAASNTAAAPAFGAFGQTQQTPAANAFGQPQQAAPAFGATPQTGTGLFGQPAAANTNTGAFGQTTNAFGTTNATPNAFGATNTTNAFGQAQQPAQNTGTGLFGQTSQQQQPTTNAFGAFGANNNAPKPSVFGTGTTGNAFGTTTTGSIFGQQNPANQQQQQQQQPQQQPGGIFGQTGTTNSIFGQNNQAQQPAQPAQAGTGLFGQTQPAQTGGLFGSTFGQNQQQNQQQQQPQQQNAFGSTGIFGQPKPATTGTGLFGQTQPAAATSAQPTGGLFGGAFGTNNASQGATTNAFGSNLFGQPKPANAFGATQQAAPAANTSLFGGNQSVLNVSALGSGAQPGLTASIAQPIGANLPIFDLLGPGPRSIVLDQPKKKSVFFADIPTRQPIPRLQLGYTPSQSKLRGFTSTTNGPASLTFSNNSNALAISTTGAPIGTEAFFNGGASAAGLGTGGRSSVKKLVLDRDVATSDLFAQFGGRATPGSLKKGTTSKPSFNAALGIASREKDVTAPPPPPAQPAPLPTPQPEEINRNGATPNPGEPQEGEYWIQPTIPELKKLGYDQLSAFEGLVVGRVGHGQVEFTDPVNLTEVPRLQNLLGGVVQFEHKECSIYPDNSEETKPPYGQGLNVRATITIYNAWPIDKTTKEHIKDRNHKRMKRHIEILKSIPNAHFESFDYETGTWVFRVEGF